MFGVLLTRCVMRCHNVGRASPGYHKGEKVKGYYVKFELDAISFHRTGHTKSDTCEVIANRIREWVTSETYLRDYENVSS